MADPLIVLGTVITLFALILCGVHISFALAVTAFIGIWLASGNLDIALNLMATTAYAGLRDYIFAVAPLFILMGAFMTHSRTAAVLYEGANAIVGKVRGGLAIATVYANAIFAAVTGVSVASAAVFATVSFPQMKRHGYSTRLALGSVAGSSVLGMLIPPSILMIVYGLLTQVSIGALFLGGVVPGILLAVLFSLGIAFLVRVMPRFSGDISSPPSPRPIDTTTVAVARTRAEAPQVVPRRRPPDLESTHDLGEVSSSEEQSNPGNVSSPRGSGSGSDPVSTGSAIAKSLPIFGLVVAILGGIWTGVFSPTEASGIGAVGGLILAFAYGMGGRGLLSAFRAAAISTGAVMILLLSAMLYSRMLAMTGVISSVQRFIAGLDVRPLVIVVLFIVILVIMGAVLDSVSILLLAVPVMFPTVLMLGVDPLWFGIVMIVAVEVGMLTPPFGMVPFAMRAVLSHENRVEDIFVGALPFIVIMFILIALMIAFPPLVTWLPNRM